MPCGQAVNLSNVLNYATKLRTGTNHLKSMLKNFIAKRLEVLTEQVARSKVCVCLRLIYNPINPV